MHPIDSNDAVTRSLGWLAVGRGGAIAASRVVAIARANSAPVKRLLQAAGPSRILNLTYGEPRESVLLLESGHLVVISIPLELILSQLQEVPHA